MSLVMAEQEAQAIDRQIEGMAGWALTRKAEAEQLSMDAARLLSCTGDRLDSLRGQRFFQRCWSRFSGEAGEIERANAADLIQMQKCSLRYINMMQEQHLMMAHSMISLKNNLLNLAVREEETRNLIAKLAERIRNRFDDLENRVERLEISSSLQGWILGLEERGYEKRFPTNFMRLFQVINDFYTIKNDDWNYDDLIFMRTAIRKVGLDPVKKLSLNTLIALLTDEIHQESVGIDRYTKSVTQCQPQGFQNFSEFVIEEISSPVFVSLHGLKSHYSDRLEIIEQLNEEMYAKRGRFDKLKAVLGLSKQPDSTDALKLLLRKSISKMNVNLDYAFPLDEAAFEILGCLRLANQLAKAPSEPEQSVEPVQCAVETVFNSCGAECIQVSGENIKNKIKLNAKIADLGSPEWVLKSLPANDSVVEIISVDDYWVMVGEERLYKTSNFSSWETFNIEELRGDIVHAGDFWFSLGWSCDGFKISSDGIDWKKIHVPHGDMDGVKIKNVVVHCGHYVLCGTYRRSYYTTSKGFLRDKTEEHWYDSPIFFTTKNFEEFTTYWPGKVFDREDVTTIYYGNGKFVFICGYGGSIIGVSENLTSWSKQDIGKDIGWLQFSNGVFVMRPYGCDTIYISEDCIEWKNIHMNKVMPSLGEMKKTVDGCVFFKGDQGDDESFIRISEDLIDWFDIEIPEMDTQKSGYWKSRGILSLAFRNGKMVIGDAAGRIGIWEIDY